MRSDAKANRGRILSAAEVVFGEFGEAASTEEVARRAGVGIGTVFRHFPTKQALVEATVVDHFERLTERALALTGGSAPGRAFRELIGTLIHDSASKLALVGLLESSGGVTDRAEQASRDLKAAVKVLLREAQAAGEVRRDVTVDEVYLLIRGLSQAARVPGSAKALHAAVKVVLDGLEPR